MTESGPAAFPDSFLFSCVFVALPKEPVPFVKDSISGDGQTLPEHTTSEMGPFREGGSGLAQNEKTQATDARQKSSESPTAEKTRDNPDNRGFSG